MEMENEPIGKEAQVLSQNACPTSMIVEGRVVGFEGLIHPPKPKNITF